MNLGFLAAALASGLTTAIHVFLGGPQLVGPLLGSALAPTVKHTHYYCWHLVTLVLCTMSAGFGWAAVAPGALELAVALTGLSASFGLWSVVLVIWSGQSSLELPQWSLFLGIAAAGGAGLWGAL